MSGLSSMRRPSPVHPALVRYIKLGQGGSWEKDCLAQGTIRFGFGTQEAERLRLCLAGQWDRLAETFLAEGKSKGTATHFTNETRTFFEDDGSTLWITFVGERLYWGTLTTDLPVPHLDGDGLTRIVNGGWRYTDLNGEQLTKDRLSGALTKLVGYRGTSCRVDVPDYVIRRVNGEKTPEVERAIAALTKMKASALELMRLMEPRDFETLVDLVFTASGWRRLGVVGKTQKTLDLDLVLPSTGERAIVQVKSKASTALLHEYIARFGELGPYDRMFFVFHSGEAMTEDDRVSLVGPEKLSELVVEAGLVEWLIRKVS